MLAGRLQRSTDRKGVVEGKGVGIGRHLPIAKRTGAALCRGLRASSRRYHRPTGQIQQPGRTQDWIKLGGKVTGKRMQNGFIESFNGRLRDELLNETLFTSLAQARVALRCWRVDYNDRRPHSQLGWKTPSEFAFTCHPRRDLALRYAEGSAPAPVATTAQPGKSSSRGELRTG